MASTLQYLIEQNARWAKAISDADPEYFLHLSRLQAPKHLWIGCADSRVPANVITGLEPGEIFVHRNVANIIDRNDPNCMSVVEFAIEALGVEHIIVCGHYGCGGVRAALDPSAARLVDHWVQPLRDLAHDRQQDLARYPDIDARHERLCELNVAAQVENLATTAVLRKAWAAGKRLEIHGWIYRLTEGLLRELCATTG